MALVISPSGPPLWGMWAFGLPTAARLSLPASSGRPLMRTSYFPSGPNVFYWGSAPSPVTPCALFSFTYLLAQIPAPGGRLMTTCYEVGLRAFHRCKNFAARHIYLHICRKISQAILVAHRMVLLSMENLHQGGISIDGIQHAR